MLYSESRAAMVGFARERLRTEKLPVSLAEDLVQETWIVVLRHQDTIQFPLAYAYQVLRGKVQQESRRKTVHEPTESAHFNQADAPSSDVFDQVDTKVAVHQALRQIPRQQRTALYRNKGLEEPAQEVAAACRIPTATVYSRVSLARATLCTILMGLTVAMTTWLFLELRLSILVEAGNSHPGPGRSPDEPSLFDTLPWLPPLIVFGVSSGFFGSAWAAARRWPGPERPSRRRTLVSRAFSGSA